MKKIFQYLSMTLMASCFIAQAEVSAKCTDVIVDYCDGGNNMASDWRASAIYTPCGATHQERTVLYGAGYRNYHLSIESGTEFSIGETGTTNNIYDLYPNSGNRACPQGDTFHVYCGGNVFGGGTYPYCSTDSKCVCRSPRTYPCAPVSRSDICPPAPQKKKPIETKTTSSVKKPVQPKKPIEAKKP